MTDEQRDQVWEFIRAETFEVPRRDRYTCLWFTNFCRVFDGWSSRNDLPHLPAEVTVEALAAAGYPLSIDPRGQSVVPGLNLSSRRRG